MTDRPLPAAPRPTAPVPPDLRVCRVDPAMWRTHRALRLAMLLDTPRAFDSHFAREAAFTDEQWRARVADSVSWLAWRGVLPVGSVTLYQPEAREAFLVAMWVAAHARGSGVGAALVQALLDHAAATDVRRVRLDVAQDNEAAVRLYERFGFERTGVTGALTHDPGVPEFEMARKLDEGGELTPQEGRRPALGPGEPA